MPPKPTYSNLFKLVKDRNYFVITTNVDHCFQKAGFDKGRLFYTQGDYGLFQCSQPCHKKTYDNESAIKAMVEEQKDFKIPTTLIPKCPKCGKPMTTNLRSDDRFVEDEGWHIACTNYENFLRSNMGKDVLFIELGVGMNTPGIIKYPFWRLTLQNSHAHYACINLGDAYAPDEIAKRSLCIDDDIDKVICDILSLQ
jgi:NAD-dependent SIR2 family protein deacetylase